MANFFATPDPKLIPNQAQFITDASQNIVNKAAEVADIPYQQYEGTKVAPLSENQKIAQQAAKNYRGAAFRKDYFDPARNLISGNKYTAAPVSARDVGTKAFSQDAIDQYMSPYIQKAIDPVLRKSKERSQRRINELKRVSGMKGAFGGSRVAVDEYLANRLAGEEQTDIQSSGLQNAYNAATGLFTTDQNRQLKADLANQGVDVSLGKFNEGQRANQATIATNQAATLGNLGGQFSGVRNDIVRRLLSTGVIDQTTAQNIINADIKQFEDKFNYPTEKLKDYVDIVGTAPQGGGSLIPQQNDLTSTVSGVANLVKGLDAITGGLGSELLKTGGEKAIKAAAEYFGIGGNIASGVSEAGTIIGADGLTSAGINTALDLPTTSLLGDGAVTGGIGDVVTGTVGADGLVGGAGGIGVGAALSGTSAGTITGASGLTSTGVGYSLPSTSILSSSGTTATASAGGVGSGAGLFSTVVAPAAAAIAVFMGLKALGGGFRSPKAAEASSSGSIDNGKLSFQPIKAKGADKDGVIPLQKDAKDMINNLNKEGVDTSGVNISVGTNNSDKEGQGGKIKRDMIANTLSGLPPFIHDMALRKYNEAQQRKLKGFDSKNKFPPSDTGFIDIQKNGDDTSSRIWFVDTTKDQMINDMGLNETWFTQEYPDFDTSQLNMDSVLTKDDAFKVAKEMIQGYPEGAILENNKSVNRGAGLKDNIPSTIAAVA